MRIKNTTNRTRTIKIGATQTIIGKVSSVLDAIERFNHGAGGTAKKAKFESKNAAYIQEHIQLVKKEALVEIMLEQTAARKQNWEEANALINLLQSRTDAQAQETITASLALDAIMTVHGDLRKQIAALKSARINSWSRRQK